MESGASEFDAMLDAARSGDERAASRLFEAFNPRLLRFLRAFEPRVAEDLAGEVWLAIAKGLAAFEGGEGGFRAWSFSIARRRIADHRRRGVRRATDPVDPEVVANHVDRLSTEDPIGDLLDSWTAQDAIAQLTLHLSDDQAEVVLLRILGDFSVDEVAAVMDRPASWVRVTQHRALRRLSQRLGSRFAVTE
ncbi:MAG TPA: RNA polymerase sigma factor [Microthrixaceae bacterium]|nr:RNA polymerase sigma factor [Microthrixaceae bacterium]